MHREGRRGRVDGAGRRVLAIVLCAGLLTACSESPDEMLASARSYLAKNDVSAASIQLKNALQQDGNIAEARFLLGTISLGQGDVAGALRDLQRAQDLGYPSAQVAPHLARALVLSGSADKVIADFGTLTLEDPLAQAQVLKALGDAHMAKGERDKGRAMYEAALVSNPENGEARLGLAFTMVFAGESDSALAEIDKIIAANPKAADANALRADILLGMNRKDEARSALEAAIAVQPRNANYHFALISLILRDGAIDDAERHLEAMKAVAAKNPLTQYLSAFIDFRKDRLTTARESIDAVLRVSPDYLPAQLLAGSIYLKLEQHVQAQRYLETVLARDPGQALARRLLAASLLSTGDATRAREVVKPLTDTASDATTMTLAGQIHLATGDIDNASAFFARAVDASPEDAGARTRLAIARMSAGDTERALADLESATELEGGTGQPEFALVLAHLRSGAYDEALKAQQQLELKQPQNPQTYNVKGGILMAKRDLSGARAAFGKALELNPAFLSAAVNLARIDLAENKVADAKQRFERLIVANPTSVDAYLLLAELQLRTADAPADILATLERGLKANPTSMSAKLAIARFHLSQRDMAKALAVAQEVVAANPNDPLPLSVLAEAQLAAGDRQQAIASYNRLVALQPSAPQPLVALANAQSINGDRGGATQSLRRALAIQPDYLDAQQRLFALFAQERKFDEAVAIARDVQKQRPEAAQGFVMEGDVLMARERWAEAVQAFESAFGKAASGELAAKLHTARTRAGKVTEADTALTEWIAANPADLVARGYRAERAIAEQRLEAAEKDYREILVINPDNALTLNNLAWVAGQLGRADAVELGERALRLAPDNAAVLDTLGLLLIKKGEHDKGLAMLERAVELAPRSGALKINLVNAYIELGKKDEARTRLDEVLKEAPADSPLYVEATRLRQGL